MIHFRLALLVVSLSVYTGCQSSSPSPAAAEPAGGVETAQIDHAVIYTRIYDIHDLLAISAYAPEFDLDLALR